MKRVKNWFQKNYEQILTWKIFGPSHSRIGSYHFYAFKKNSDERFSGSGVF